MASEYEQLTRRYLEARGEDFAFVRSYGATEVFPPEDADAIVDNTATGATLSANGLEITEVLLESSTRLYASPHAMDVPEKREAIENLVLLLRSVLEARARVVLEMNVAEADLTRLIDALPCMREPTISPLHAGKSPNW